MPAGATYSWQLRTRRYTVPQSLIAPRIPSPPNWPDLETKHGSPASAESSRAISPESPPYIDTATALANAGYRTAEFQAQKMKFCICGMGEDERVNLEDWTRCDNRSCEPGWFHLECVKLPDHPASHLSWMCPGCAKRLHGDQHVSGLTDWRNHNDLTAVKEWLRTSWKLKKAEEERMKASEAVNYQNEAKEEEAAALAVGGVKEEKQDKDGEHRD